MHPEDLIKFGMIPEFVGRLPVVATLAELDQAALVEILKEPKNSLVKQYQTMLEFENVQLRFTDDAIEAIAEEALARNVGARGLRIIIEELMLDVMYQIPSRRRHRGVRHHRGTWSSTTRTRSRSCARRGRVDARSRSRRDPEWRLNR